MRATDRNLTDLARTAPGPGSRAGGRRALTGALVAAVLLAVVAAVVVGLRLETIRLLHLQAFEKGQLWRFGLLAVATASVAVAGVAWRRRRRAGWLGGVLVGLMALDLLTAASGLNPTVPPEQFYPSTPGLATLRRLAGGTRVAPVGDADQFLEGHQWSVYGIATVSGFDFAGDAEYREFFRLATGVASPASWGFLGIPATSVLDLRLLGLLDVGYIVTPPFDSGPRLGGYVTAGEMTSGRVLRQSFVCRWDGLRRVDVLTATFGRRPAGSLTVAILDDASGRTVASRIVSGTEVPDNGWLAVEVPEQTGSAGRRYEIIVTSADGQPGRASTVWLSVSDGDPAGALTIDGRVAVGDVWFRAFSAARTRWPDGELIHTGDLNIYRNRLACQRAWFVERAVPVSAGEHLSRLADRRFDPAREAVVVASSPVERLATGSARVLSTQTSAEDAREFGVHAPDGGVLVIAERMVPGWHATIDGRSVDLLRADSIVMAVVGTSRRPHGQTGVSAADGAPRAGRQQRVRSPAVGSGVSRTPAAAPTGGQPVRARPLLSGPSGCAHRRSGRASGRDGELRSKWPQPGHSHPAPFEYSNGSPENSRRRAGEPGKRCGDHATVVDTHVGEAGVPDLFGRRHRIEWRFARAVVCSPTPKQWGGEASRQPSRARIPTGIAIRPATTTRGPSPARRRALGGC